MSQPGTRKRMGWILGFLFFICLIAFAAWAIAAPAYRAERLAAGFSRFGDLEAAGVNEADLPVIAGGIAAYLKGESTSAQVQIERHGEMQDAFSQREIDHMPDVKRLTDWARFIWRIGLVAFALVAADCLRAANDREWTYPRMVGRSLLWAGLVFLGIMAVIGLWALLDFTGFFYQMHEWLFPNDFWQLDPGQHLMIQLMPEAFFTDYALTALKRMAWLLWVFPLAILLMRWSPRRAGT